LCRIIEDDNLRARLAKNGKSVSLDNYNYGKLVFNIEALYSNLIEENEK